jgi:hypothetical protein
MHARSFSLLAAAALLAAPLGVARAQYDNNMNGTPSRFTVEGYLSQQWVKSDVTDKYDGVGGVGARVMFGHSDATKVVSTFFQRARAGAFVTYFAKQGGSDLTAFHIGGQADFPLLATPMAYLDPFVSLGAGVFHTSVNGATAGTNTTSNDFALTPAVGTLIPITGAIKFRGDLRDAIIFGQNRKSNNFVAEGGISVGF